MEVTAGKAGDEFGVQSELPAGARTHGSPLQMAVGLAIVLILGTWIPRPVTALLADATRLLGATP